MPNHPAGRAGAALERLGERIGAAQVTITVEPGVAVLFVHGALFEQVLVNLLDNAVDFSPEGGTVRIWVAGCATGEEVYSMAIMLEEAGLLHKSLLYATDINPAVIENIQRGIFPLSAMKQYSENYIASGGKGDFSEYYTVAYDRVQFHPKLKGKMIAATHNLVSDRSFNEFQVIFCRNVLIYFDKVLQDKVLKLFDDSLENLGYLALGAKETIRFSSIAVKYNSLGKEKIWRKQG